MSERCQILVWNSSERKYVKCGKNTIIEWTDRHHTCYYCAEHDPVVRAGKQAKKKAKVEARTLRRLKHFGVVNKVGGPSALYQLLDVAEKLEKEVEALKKELALHTGAWCGW